MVKEIDVIIDLAEFYMEKFGGFFCGEIFDFIFVCSVNEINIIVEYVFIWEWSLDCNVVDILLGFNLVIIFFGIYEIVWMILEDVLGSIWIVDNFFIGVNYVFNGIFECIGVQEFKVCNQNVFIFVIIIEVDDLNIDKGIK